MDNCQNSPSPALGLLGLGGLLILSHLEQLVRQAFGVGTVGLPELGNVHHVGFLKIYPLNFKNKIVWNFPNLRSGTFVVWVGAGWWWWVGVFVNTFFL